MSESKDAGFLERWSRLKRDGGELPPESEGSVPAASSVEKDGSATTAPASTVPAEEAPAPLTDADMPPIESLTEASDFSQFLSQGVSDALRRRALRKLFALPEFNIRDGLNDYDDDFSEFVPLGDVIPYQMKEWLKRRAEAAMDGDGAPVAGAQEDADGQAAAGQAKPATDEVEGDGLGCADG